MIFVAMGVADNATDGIKASKYLNKSISQVTLLVSQISSRLSLSKKFNLNFFSSGHIHKISNII